MTGNEYQKQARRTQGNQPTWWLRLAEAAMGISGEAGELSEIIKKGMFQGHKVDREKVKEELGDILWYVAEMADGMEIAIDDIMTANLQKLRERYPEGFDTEKSVNRGTE